MIMINSGREWDWMDKKTKMMSKEFMNGIQKELDVYEISKVAIKIVAYFNQDETVWDSKMYEQKHVVIDLLNQLNQNKDE